MHTCNDALFIHQSVVFLYLFMSFSCLRVRAVDKQMLKVIQPKTAENMFLHRRGRFLFLLRGVLFIYKKLTPRFAIYLRGLCLFL